MCVDAMVLVAGVEVPPGPSMTPRCQMVYLAAKQKTRERRTASVEDVNDSLLPVLNNDEFWFDIEDDDVKLGNIEGYVDSTPDQC